MHGLYTRKTMARFNEQIRAKEFHSIFPCDAACPSRASAAISSHPVLPNDDAKLTGTGFGVPAKCCTNRGMFEVRVMENND